jgi:hypothetical protein
MGVKMKKILLLILFFSFTLIGCEKTPESTTEILDTPENIFFDGVLTWNAVEGAETYDLKINGVSQIMDITYYDGLVEEGTYLIEIVAQTSGEMPDSEVATYILIIDYDQDATISFQLNQNDLTWNDVPQATHYLVSYGESFERVSTNTYDISDFSESELTVQAVFPDGSKTAAFTYVITNDTE